MTELDQIVKTYHNDNKVDAGFYWHRDSWEMKTISGKKGGYLPGKRDDYVRVPALAMLAAAPMMGAALVVFLPVAGMYMVGEHFYKKASAGIKRMPMELATAGKASLEKKVE